MLISRLRLAFLTLLLAVVALWFTKQQNKAVQTTSVTSDQQLPYSWQTENAIVWRMTPSTPDQQTIIKTKQLVYQAHNKRSEFSEPHLQLIRSDSRTELTSQSGFSQDDTQITFNDHVVVNHSDSKQNQSSQLTTDSLTYHSDTNRITTDAKVTISQYNGQTIGTGLEVDLNRAEYKLLSDVKGQYDPNKFERPNDSNKP